MMRLLRLLHLVEHLHRFLRMHRDVLSYEGGVRHQFLQHLHRSTLTRGEETVNIHDFLARHQVGELSDIWIFHLCYYFISPSFCYFMNTRLFLMNTLYY